MHMQHMNSSAQCHLTHSSEICAFTRGVCKVFGPAHTHTQHLPLSGCGSHTKYSIAFPPGKHNLAELLSVKTNNKWDNNSFPLGLKKKKKKTQQQMRSRCFTLQLWKTCNSEYLVEILYTERDTRSCRSGVVHPGQRSQ